MIEVSELRKSYGEKEHLITAVDGLSFRISPGTVFGLIGPNGAGKTTTIRMMTTLGKPSGGTCSIAGENFGGTRDCRTRRKQGTYCTGFFRWYEAQTASCQSAPDRS